MRLGVLVSGNGSNLQAILDASRAGQIDVDVAVVISNRPQAPALERARSAGVPAFTVSHRRYPDRDAYEDALVALLHEHGVAWVALAGFMRLVGPRLLGAYPQRVLNIHPALLPAFPGLHAQEAAFAAGVKVAGCTVHLVDEGTDTGPIVAQAAVPVAEDDDVESLRARILEQEHRLYPQVLQLAAEGRLRCEGRRVRISAAEDAAVDKERRPA